jgi:hypothetical protein
MALSNSHFLTIVLDRCDLCVLSLTQLYGLLSVIQVISNYLQGRDCHFLLDVAH